LINLIYNFSNITCKSAHLINLNKGNNRNFIHNLTFVAMEMKEDVINRWWKLQAKLMETFGRKPDLETVLYLIGIQEAGLEQNEYSKEEKQDLMHIGICTVLSSSGYYILNGNDEDGWPHFTQLKELPVMNPIEQEDFIKDHVLLYFEQINY